MKCQLADTGSEEVLPEIDSRPGPSPYLENLVAKGKLGFKSGEGFRTWSTEEQAELEGLDS